MHEVTNRPIAESTGWRGGRAKREEPAEQSACRVQVLAHVRINIALVVLRWFRVELQL